MSAIRGTYKDGQIILAAAPPTDWPDGAEVRLELVDPLGTDSDEGDDPESIAMRLAEHDALEPFLSEEDDARWRKARQEYKEWELANREKRDKMIEGFFP